MIEDHPILFSSEMVSAIFHGYKTNTRRVCKCLISTGHKNAEGFFMSHNPMILHKGDWLIPYEWSPYGKPGDRLWVREKWQAQNEQGQWWHEVKSGRELYNWAWTNPVEPAIKETPPRWLPSIHMPRAASRITLELLNVRIERIQDISAEDIVAEGIQRPLSPNQKSVDELLRFRFMELWNSLNKARGFGWDKNPWVWVLGFKAVV